MFKELYDYLYHAAPTGGLPLKLTGILLGLLLLASHVWALLNAAKVQAFLKAFPRSQVWGVLLLTVAFAWGMLVLVHIDMGEFYWLRKYFLAAVPVGYILMMFCVKEFLAVRALGSLLLLAAGPVLTAAFLQPQMTRLLLPILAYAWIFAGFFFVGMPFVLRDLISWVVARPGRWALAVWSGILYGGAMLVLAVLTY